MKYKTLKKNKLVKKTKSQKGGAAQYPRNNNKNSRNNNTNSSFNAEKFITHLTEISNYLNEQKEIRDKDIGNQYKNVNIIKKKLNTIFKVYIHVKTSEESKEPEIDFQTANLNNMLYFFNERYKDNIEKGYKDLEIYEQTNKMDPCLDVRITFLDKFLIEEINIFIKDDESNNNTQLVRILFNILTNKCNENRRNIKTKKEYNKIFNKDIIYEELLQNEQINKALEKKIITTEFINKTLMDYIYYNFKNENNNNNKKKLYDCNSIVDDYDLNYDNLNNNKPLNNNKSFISLLQFHNLVKLIFFFLFH
jgi:hypothetical protein